jgi:hypothetical protein
VNEFLNGGLFATSGILHTTTNETGDGSGARETPSSAVVVVQDKDGSENDEFRIFA